MTNDLELAKLVTSERGTLTTYSTCIYFTDSSCELALGGGGYKKVILGKPNYQRQVTDVQRINDIVCSLEIQLTCSHNNTNILFIIKHFIDYLPLHTEKQQ